jgi:hypothetical protein
MHKLMHIIDMAHYTILLLLLAAGAVRQRQQYYANDRKTELRQFRHLGRLQWVAA